MSEYIEVIDTRPAPPDYVVGVDAGQIRDFTAIVVLERRERPAPGQPVPGPPSFVTRLGLGPRPVTQMEAIYAARWVERLPLDTPYPQQVRHVAELVRRVRDGMDRTNPGRLAVVLDATGVGVAVGDLFRDADLGDDVAFVPVTITAGDATTLDGRGGYRVPKRTLVSVVQVLLQSRRLRVAAGLPAAATLEQELRTFRAKISLSGHDQYGAGEDWRSAPHDDLVLALAVASWFAETQWSPENAAIAAAWAQSMHWSSRRVE
jgi:hypothetical protein